MQFAVTGMSWLFLDIMALTWYIRSQFAQIHVFQSLKFWKKLTTFAKKNGNPPHSEDMCITWQWSPLPIFCLWVRVRGQHAAQRACHTARVRAAQRAQRTARVPHSARAAQHGLPVTGAASQWPGGAYIVLRCLRCHLYRINIGFFSTMQIRCPKHRKYICTMFWTSYSHRTNKYDVYTI